MKKQKTLTAIALISTVLLAVLFLLFWIQYQNKKKDAAVYATCTAFTNLLAETDFTSLPTGKLTGAAPFLSPDTVILTAPVPGTAIGQVLFRAYYDSLSFPSHSEPVRRGSSATVNIAVSALSFDSLQSDINTALQSALIDKLHAASVSSEIYNTDLSFREDVVAETFFQIIATILETPASSAPAFETVATDSSSGLQMPQPDITIATCSLSDDNNDNTFVFTDCSALERLICGSNLDFDTFGKTLFENAYASLTYVRKEYSLPTDTHRGPLPDANGFQSSANINDVFAMLEHPLAVQLLNGREPFFRANLPFMPDMPFHWYLDETILVIVWKEITAGCAGTYSEIVISDGSQLCRKIVDDTLYQPRYIPATLLAADTNAVLALGGDIYAHPDRRIGIQVYDGVVTAWDDSSCDTCMFTADGDMIFTYRNQFETQEEAQAFVDEHNVRFSMAFGPVIIEDGRNVAPAAYQWGEIYDTYARASIGMKDGPCHYLSVNINEDGPSYWNLATLQDEIDAMLAHGCTRAYAMDGGQTCCTILGGQLLNRVQFNRERDTSDIIFFATAVPNAEPDSNTEEE